MNHFTNTVSTKRKSNIYNFTFAFSQHNIFVYININNIIIIILNYFIYISIINKILIPCAKKKRFY